MPITITSNHGTFFAGRHPHQLKCVKNTTSWEKNAIFYSRGTWFIIPRCEMVNDGLVQNPKSLNSSEFSNDKHVIVRRKTRSFRSRGKCNKCIFMIPKYLVKLFFFNVASTWTEFTCTNNIAKTIVCEGIDQHFRVCWVVIFWQLAIDRNP